MRSKGLFLSFLLVFVVGTLAFFEYSSARRGRRGRRSRRATSVVRAKLPIPVAGKTYTVGQLFDLINMNNPRKNSNFRVPRRKGRLLPDDKCWSTKLKGSYPANTAKLPNELRITPSWLRANGGIKVALQADPELIEYLAFNKRLKRKTKTKYARILLYFKLQSSRGAVYRFYINDPWPGKIRRTSRGKVNPAGKILKRWDFNKSF